MAVTTGTTTGTTNSSSGSSNNPTGGSLQAPARTEPSKSTTSSGNASTGQGGQGSTSSSSSTSSTPSSSGSSSGTSESSTESSSNTTTDTATNTTTATKSEPSTDTALKSPTQQAEVNKQKEAYTDYGGAYTTIDAPPALPQASKQESVKVVDPARSSSSNNGTTTGTGGQPQTVAGGKTDNTAVQPTSTAGKTDSQATTSTAKPTTTPTTPSGTSTAWGGGITAPQTSAPGKTSTPSSKAYPSATDTAWAGDLTNPATPASGKTDKQPTPTVAGLSGTSTIWGGPPVTRGLTAGEVNGPAPAPAAPSGTSTAWGATNLPASAWTPQQPADPGMWSPNVNQSMQENWLDSTLTGNLVDTLTGGVLQQGTLPTTIPQQMEGFVTNAGNFIDSLFGGGVESIAPGATTEAMMRTPGMSYGNPAPNSGLSYQDPTAVAPAGSYNAASSMFGMQPVRNSMTPAQAIAQDPIGYNGPRVGTAPPSAPTPSVVNPSSATVADLENRVLQAQQGTLMAPYAQPPAKIVDRVPPQAPNYPTVTDPRTAQMQEQLSVPTTVTDPRMAQMQEQFNKIAAARGQTAKIVNTPVSLPGDPPTPPMQPIPAPSSLGIMPGIADPRMAQMQEQRDIGAMQGSMQYPGADGITPDDIGGVFENGAVADPTSAEGMTVEDMVQALTPQPTTPVRQGLVNPYYRSPAEQAQAVQNSVALAMGPRPPAAPMPPAPSPQVVAPQPVAPRPPTSINISGGNVPMDPSVMGRNAQAIANQSVAPSQQMPTGPIGAQGGLGVQAYPGVVQTPPLNVPTNSSTAQRDQYYGGGPTETLGTPENVPPQEEPQQASPVTVTNPEAPVPPSQEGEYPPNENPSQVAGQPQTVGELYNRYQYEKERAKQGFYDLPGNLFNAITSGDIRGYTPEPNDRGTDPLPYGVHPGTPGTGNSAMLAQQAALINRLVAMLRQQQLGVAPSQADLVFNTFV